MVKFWRKVQPGPPPAQPAVPADLVAWAGEVDVSRLSDRTFQDAEDYLKGYRYMNLDLSQQMGWRLIAAVEAQVTPSPPADAQGIASTPTALPAAALTRARTAAATSGPAAFNSHSRPAAVSGTAAAISAAAWQMALPGDLPLRS
jgi:hypothetical protein